MEVFFLIGVFGVVSLVLGILSATWLKGRLKRWLIGVGVTVFTFTAFITFLLRPAFQFLFRHMQ